MASLQSITVPWAGEERRFFLPTGGLRAVQAKCDAGPEEILARMAPSVTALERDLGPLAAMMAGLVGRWRIDDVREPIFQGLLGGGMDHLSASALTVEYFDRRPPRENLQLAFSILLAAVSGVPDEPGEPVGETESGAPRSPGASSASASSTKPRRARASRRARSTNSASGSSESP